ncbi:hypothetical protein [Cyanobacterium sp. Dongsha4]|nr:hypothetical protein [Cyanobacterium sp. Dongsha4]
MPEGINSHAARILSSTRAGSAPAKKAKVIPRSASFLKNDRQDS